MASFISAPLLLFIGMLGVTPAISQSTQPTEPPCLDWGESSQGAVSLVQGDSGWLSCPLFSHPTIYNYSSYTGHNLFWYHIPEGHDLERPIKYSARVSKDQHRLWLQPVTANDTGLYICTLGNRSSCSKIAMRLTVIQRDEAVRDNACQLPVVGPASQVVIALNMGKTLQCPSLQNIHQIADSEPTVSWYHETPETSRCDKFPSWNTHRQQKGADLRFNLMLKPYRGLYYCTVHYKRGGKSLNYSRSINVTAVYRANSSQVPTILHPSKEQNFTVKQGTKVKLVCRGLFPYHESPRDIWWTVNGKKLDELPDNSRFSQINSQVHYDYGDWTEESILVIDYFEAEDLNREFNCSVKNGRGFSTRRARLEEEEHVTGVLVQLFRGLLSLILYSS